MNPKIAEVIARENCSESTARRRLKGAKRRPEKNVERKRMVRFLREVGFSVTWHPAMGDEAIFTPPVFTPLFPGGGNKEEHRDLILGDRLGSSVESRTIRLDTILAGDGTVRVKNAVATTVPTYHHALRKVRAREAELYSETRHCRFLDVRETSAIYESIYSPARFQPMPTMGWDWLDWGPWGEIIRATWWPEYVARFQDGSPYSRLPFPLDRVTLSHANQFPASYNTTPCWSGWKRIYHRLHDAHVRSPLLDITSQPQMPTAQDTAQFFAQRNITLTPALVGMTLREAKAWYANPAFLPKIDGVISGREPHKTYALMANDSEEAKAVANALLIARHIDAQPEIHELENEAKALWDKPRLVKSKPKKVKPEKALTLGLVPEWSTMWRPEKTEDKVLTSRGKDKDVHVWRMRSGVNTAIGSPSELARLRAGEDSVVAKWRAERADKRVVVFFTYNPQNLHRLVPRNYGIRP
jgi:hypothetical protein